MRIVPLLLAGFAAACTPSGIEGKYYNSQTGQFAMELKDGKVLMAPGMEFMNAAYTVRGDSVIVSDPKGGTDNSIVLIREKDGTLSAGMLGSLKKK